MLHGAVVLGVCEYVGAEVESFLCPFDSICCEGAVAN